MGQKKVKEFCAAEEVSGEEPITCGRQKGHNGPHRTGAWPRYDRDGSEMKRGEMWVCWTAPTPLEEESE